MRQLGLGLELSTKRTRKREFLDEIEHDEGPGRIVKSAAPCAGGHRQGPYCVAHPDRDMCEALKRAGVDPRLPGDVPVSAWVHEPRIHTAVIAAPAFGFSFGRAGLSGVHVPIQLWRAADDRHQPDPYYDEAVRADLPRPPEYHVVANARHYDFLPPCDARLSRKAAEICNSQPGFDRVTFHERFNADMVKFFQTTLQ